jgi:transposase
VQAAKVAKGGGLAAAALEYIRRLYGTEAEASKRQLGPEERQALREREAKPVLKEFKGWLERTALETPPKLTLGKAINYALSGWVRLERYADDGRIEIDNNLIENAIRPYCVGRRAWLFHDSPQGAKAGAALYGLIETAKASGLEPYHYLRYLFTNLLEMKPDDEYAALLPTRLNAQDIVLPPPDLTLAQAGGS